MPDAAQTDAARTDAAQTGAAQAAEDLRFMARAIELGRAGKAIKGAGPIGCVIVLDGRIIGEGHNESGLRHDPTAHAEIVALRRACAALETEALRGATLYTSLQPCGMCSMASIWSRISRIVYAAGRADVHWLYFEDEHVDTLDLIRDTYRHIELVGGVMRDEALGLYFRPGETPPLEEVTNV